MSIRDGGSAFPESKRRVENYMDEGGYGRSRIVTVQEGGLSRRDYFAAKSLAGMLAAESEEKGFYEPAIAAKRAYAMADAMLAERDKENNDAAR